MIDRQISRLAEILAVEARVYRDLRRLLSEERERMLDLDAESLYGLATRKEVLAEEGRIALEARTQAVSDLADSVEVPRPGLTLSTLCDALGERAIPLREAQSRLLAIIGAVRELSEANQRLGGERLTEVQTTLQLLGRLAPIASGMADTGNAGGLGRNASPPSSGLVRRFA